MRNFLAKRLFDISFSSFGIMLSLPLWIMISLMIFKEDKGPVYYIQKRVGKKGRLFNMIKFRSMQVEAEKETGPIQARGDDVRNTKIGHLLRITALDELPQLINILKGDMSFVGPRPLRADELENITHVHTHLQNHAGIDVRQAVTPGLTGVAQVLEPRDIQIDKKARYDIWYVKNNSLILDLWLICISFLITFLGRWETNERYKTRLCMALSRHVNLE
ncbi:MAG: sugar transferase [Candidatus Omnitrophica bacterium]|nr:sugar transferase [Candidatus Omnitrophota bacterium]